MSNQVRTVRINHTQMYVSREEGQRISVLGVPSQAAGKDSQVLNFKPKDKAWTILDELLKSEGK
jgi:hypothetical protein